MRVIIYLITQKLQDILLPIKLMKFRNKFKA